ncbi:hypothetical protein JB92DRAFT_2824335 [Gautieria morchelliformis]|nr:hypothetical protein JB92DRAFT_2824335 [Gautieria morchelliformis]
MNYKYYRYTDWLQRRLSSVAAARWAQCARFNDFTDGAAPKCPSVRSTSIPPLVDNPPPPDKPSTSTRADDFGAAGEILISTPLGLAVFNPALRQSNPSISLFSTTPRIEHGWRTVRSGLSAPRTKLQATSSPGPCHLSGGPPRCRQGSNMPPATSPGTYISSRAMPTHSAPRSASSSLEPAASSKLRLSSARTTIGGQNICAHSFSQGTDCLVVARDGMLLQPFADLPWRQCLHNGSEMIYYTVN